MSIDELLGLSVEELEALTDEQLLERYKSIFDLEPQVPISDVSEDDSEEYKNEAGEVIIRTPKAKKKKEAKAKLADLKAKLMEASKQGLSKDEAFDKLFEL